MVQKVKEGACPYLQQRVVNVTNPDKWSHNSVVTCRMDLSLPSSLSISASNQVFNPGPISFTPNAPTMTRPMPVQNSCSRTQYSLEMRKVPREAMNMQGPVTPVFAWNCVNHSSGRKPKRTGAMLSGLEKGLGYDKTFQIWACCKGCIVITERSKDMFDHGMVHYSSHDLNNGLRVNYWNGPTNHVICLTI